MAFYKQYDNGLRLIVDNMKNYESVAFHVLVKTGSVNEDNTNYGISHFIEHMLFKGTKTRSAYEIVNSLESIGANVNAYTDKTETCYYTKSTSEAVEKCVEVIADMLFNSSFDEKEMSREKKVVCEELSMYNDDAYSKAMMLSNKTFYHGTKFANDVGGTRKSVYGLNKKKILDYMKKYYVPNNIVISFAGNITEKKATKLVEKYFLNNFKNKGQQTVLEQNKPVLTKKTATAFKDNEQAHVCITFPALSRYDNRKYALQIFNLAFGIGMSSRLFQRIREVLGLVYSINVGSYLNEAGGDTTIHFATSTDNVPLALSSIKDEIDKVLENGITEKEFESCKTCFIANTKMKFESTSNVSLLNAKRIAYFGKLFSKKEEIQQIENITLQDVNNLIKEIFNYNNCTISYVGQNTRINLFKHFNNNSSN